jgi:hypothetical protein
MRTLLFLALILPAFATAQINRSAREFASERIQEYVVTKLFKDLPYKPVSYGEIKNYDEKNRVVSWTLTHKFEITEIRLISDKKTEVHRSYQFLFYLDKKMKVLRAETAYSAEVAFKTVIP